MQLFAICIRPMDGSQRSTCCGSGVIVSVQPVEAENGRASWASVPSRPRLSLNTIQST